MKKLGVIGVGNMANAIIKGVMKCGVISPEDIMLCDKHPERNNEFYAAGATQASDECDLVTNSRFILLSIKPQGFAALLEKIKPVCRAENVFISIAAGISAEYIKSALGYDARIVLAMPNTPISLGYGATAVARVEPTSADEFEAAMDIFSAGGFAAEIQADKLNEVIPLNGSSPAFLYRIAQIFVEKAVGMGFDSNTALRLFCGAMVGSAKMMTESGLELDELIKMVCSKGGTTLAGLDAMQRGGLEVALQQGIDACVNRAYELGKSK